MLMSNKKVRALNVVLQGHMVKAYETDFECKPIRSEQHLICGGNIVRLQPTATSIRVQCGKMPDVKTAHGYLCLILVKYAVEKYKNKIGRELLFNVAIEDIEAILAKKQKTTPTYSG